MLYGEISPDCLFRFVTFGHPPLIVFSSKLGNFLDIGDESMAQFPPLGLVIPYDLPDRNKYDSIGMGRRRMNVSDLKETSLMRRGDILSLYTDGVHDGTDQGRGIVSEQIIRQHKEMTAMDICNAILENAVRNYERLRQADKPDRVDDETVLIIKRV